MCEFKAEEYVSEMVEGQLISVMLLLNVRTWSMTDNDSESVEVEEVQVIKAVDDAISSCLSVSV